MVKIIELIAEKRKKNEEWVSYEYFPPRSAAGAANLEARFDRASKCRQYLQRFLTTVLLQECERRPSRCL